MAVVEDLLTCDAARLGEVNRGQVPRTIEGWGAPATTAPPSAKWQIQHFGRLALDVEVRCNSAVLDQLSTVHMEALPLHNLMVISSGA